MNAPIKERTILFSAPMVRAILDGRKTQTRRIVKCPVPPDVNSFTPYLNKQGNQVFGFHLGNNERFGDITELENIHCPHGKIGDRLWVRETWGWIGDKPNKHEFDNGVPVFYRADYSKNVEQEQAMLRWRPSIHMSRWASRILLEITNVRVERLNDISEEDAIAEGVHGDDDYPTDSTCPSCHGQGVHGALGSNLGWIEVDCDDCDTHKKRFVHLWESINGQGSWDLNPFCWVIEFEVIENGK